MPELPEVETIRRGLEKHIVGLTIDDVEVRLGKIARGDLSGVIGKTIIGIRRFGKGLIIDLSDNWSIAIHVKMTGQLIFQGHIYPPKNMHLSEKVGTNLPNKYTHVIFLLKGKKEEQEETKETQEIEGKKNAILSSNEGSHHNTDRARDSSSVNRLTQNDDLQAYLYFNDMRQFGWVHAGETSEIEGLPFFKSIGKEPLRDLTLDDLQRLVKQTKKLPIKQLLMDQNRIAGLGNIYANDALFLAKISPFRLANTLSDEEVARLFDAIETVLKRGIAAGGASQENFVNAEGQDGGYQREFQVYARAGRPCLVCGTTIERKKQGGRSTFYCPVCQK